MKPSSPAPPLAACAALLLGGCSGAQSALQPAGVGAERVADLWWIMATGAVLIWALVVGMAVYAVRVRPRAHDERRTRLLVIGGGAVFPTVVLTVLLLFGLGMMPGLLAPAPPGSLAVAVSGERYWWRVRYEPPGGEPFELANEIRLPVGEAVDFVLSSPDVIHSFWIPSLGPKMDMIPGRVNRVTLEATSPGTFRGACAEFCGTSHAYMAFPVVVMEDSAFARWMAAQAAPAAPPEAPAARRGAGLFLRHGCGACHTVRGTAADGRVGPDLTHVGSRLTLGAALLSADAASFARWIRATEEVKPGVHMPSFGMLPEDDVAAIAAYLEALR